MRYEDIKNITMEMIDKIKSFGYRTFLYDDGFDFIYGFYTDGDRVAYFEVDSLGFCKIGSVHKPSSEFGSGINVLDEGLLKDITKDVLEDALAIAPQWFIEDHPRKYRRIKKYTLDEYLEKSWRGKDYKEI